MTTLSTEPLHADFGARVLDVDLAADLDAETIDAIRAAVDEYSFLCFPSSR